MESKPELYVDAVEYISAFFMLVPSKKNGMGMGSILLSEMKAYIELFEVTDKLLFITCMQALDQAYSGAVKKKSK